MLKQRRRGVGRVVWRKATAWDFIFKMKSVGETLKGKNVGMIRSESSLSHRDHSGCWHNYDEWLPGSRERRAKQRNCHCGGLKQSPSAFTVLDVRFRLLSGQSFPWAGREHLCQAWAQVLAMPTVLSVCLIAGVASLLCLCAHVCTGVCLFSSYKDTGHIGLKGNFYMTSHWLILCLITVFSNEIIF